MFEATLQEELHHQGLILHLGKFGFDFGLQLVAFFQCLDLGDALNLIEVVE